MRKWLPAAVLGLVLFGVGSASAAEVIVTVRPPRAIVEHRGHAPSRGYVWMPGYYRWDGRAYMWDRGHWVLPPRPHARWVEPRWERRRHEWIFREGRWR